jgi:hypothetical protein
VNNLKSSPSPTFGYDFPSAAKNSWNGMLNADECFWSQFKEIIVVKDFDVENGLLGLEQDVYLNIVKFLNSSIVKRV